MTKKKKKPVQPAFRTTHNLPFECAKWPRSDEFLLFRIGTCHGTWRSLPGYYEILNIVNDEPGNGHFEDVLQWFGHSCRRDRRALRILEIQNRRFYKHLLNKRGFIGHVNYAIKYYE